MWARARCFDGKEECRKRRPVLGAVFLLALASGSSAEARVFLRQEEALVRAFPSPATIERKTIFLDEAEADRIETDSGEKLPGRVVAYYVGRVPGATLGYAYFDSHRIRTLPETIMVTVRPDGSLGRITILSFSEPEDYLPREPWLGQFSGRRLGSDLAIRRGIRNLTGASLTASAITSACRRILAIHRLVREREKP